MRGTDGKRIILDRKLDDVWVVVGQYIIIKILRCLVVLWIASPTWDTARETLAWPGSLPFAKPTLRHSRLPTKLLVGGAQQGVACCR
jgi:hypothetical protein